MHERSHRMLAALLLLAPGLCAALNVVDVGSASVAKRSYYENNDAYFLSPPNIYGIFDGVSACPDSREFARLLADTTQEALSGSEALVGEDRVARALSFRRQAQSALQKACERASSYSGASTALLLRLALESEPQCYTYNVGDCTSLLLRPSTTGSGRLLVAGRSKPKYHKNGAPFQFAGKGFQSDRPQDGASFAFDVRAGDIILCFTDGVTANLKPDEIARIASGSDVQGSAEAMAKCIVEAARDRCIVDDDTTAVALRLDEGPGVGEEARSLTRPAATESPMSSVEQMPFGGALDWLKQQATGSGGGGGSPEL